jgi:hypothetical protein
MAAGVRAGRTGLPSGVARKAKSAKTVLTKGKRRSRRRVPNCVVVDVSEVNFDVSDKWRKRLKELDDYQRSAPFVFGRLTLG